MKKAPREARIEIWGSWDIEMICSCGRKHTRQVTVGDYVKYKCGSCTRLWDIGFLVSASWFPRSRSAVEAGLPDAQVFAMKIYKPEYFLEPLEIWINGYQQGGVS